MINLTSKMDRQTVEGVGGRGGGGVNAKVILNMIMDEQVKTQYILILSCSIPNDRRAHIYHKTTNANPRRLPDIKGIVYIMQSYGTISVKEGRKDKARAQPNRRGNHPAKCPIRFIM